MNLDGYIRETFEPFLISPLPERRPLPIWNLDGVPWHKAPTPPRLHRCWVQTHTRLDGEIVDRCACGGLRYDGYGPWIFRNESHRPSFWVRILKGH